MVRRPGFEPGTLALTSSLTATCFTTPTIPTPGLGDRRLVCTHSRVSTVSSAIFIGRLSPMRPQNLTAFHTNIPIRKLHTLTYLMRVS